MSSKVKEVHMLHVGLPLRKEFRHALYSRSQSDSVFLKLLLEDGTVGYGEALPREYVTGETPQSVVEILKDIARRKVLGYAPLDYQQIPSLTNDLGIKGGAAKCALELALLDAYGKYFKSPVYSIIGNQFRNIVLYSGVIQADSVPDAVKTSLAFKIWGLYFIKVKVGLENDLARLRVIRGIMGKDANIRVDANCAWTADEAIAKIEEMRRYNISAVEQPVKADDYDGLKKVTDSVGENIIADESLCTVQDAERLAVLKACNTFNIRISKCGGLLNSLKIAGIASRCGISVQLGCQVGESGLLSAAGRCFASVAKDISFCEGSYGRYLLKEDVTKEDMTIQRGGVGMAVNGPGLGVNVLDEVLDKYVISRDIIR